jgi:UrcA family protein
MALAMACTAPATAQPIDDQFSVAVPYGDLNLDSPAGIAALTGRVKAKAAQACDVPPITLGQRLQVRSCRINFVRSAQRNLEIELASSAGGIRVAAR